MLFQRDDLETLFENTLDSSAVALLKRLQTEGWNCLPPQCDDDVKLLYNEPTNQWTLGWYGGDLILLQYEVASKYWRLFINGAAAGTYRDRPFDKQSQRLAELLNGESPDLVSPDDILAPLLDPTLETEHQEHRFAQLSNTLQVAPETIGVMLPAIVTRLSRRLDLRQGVQLYTIQRLSQKNMLLQLVRQLPQERVIGAAKSQLIKALVDLSALYQQLYPWVSPLLRSDFASVYAAYLHHSGALDSARKRREHLQIDRVYQSMVQTILHARSVSPG